MTAVSAGYKGAHKLLDHVETRELQYDIKREHRQERPETSIATSSEHGKREEKSGPTAKTAVSLEPRTTASGTVEDDGQRVNE